MKPSGCSCLQSRCRATTTGLSPHQVSTFVSADPGRHDDVTGDHGMLSSKELYAVGQAFQPVIFWTGRELKRAYGENREKERRQASQPSWSAPLEPDGFRPVASWQSPERSESRRHFAPSAVLSATSRSRRRKAGRSGTTQPSEGWWLMHGIIDGSGSKNDRLESLSHCRTILLEPSSAQRMRRIES
jgi:hypothetical protein